MQYAIYTSETTFGRRPLGATWRGGEKQGASPRHGASEAQEGFRCRSYESSAMGPIWPGGLREHPGSNQPQQLHL